MPRCDTADTWTWAACAELVAWAAAPISAWAVAALGVLVLAVGLVAVVFAMNQ